MLNHVIRCIYSKNAFSIRQPLLHGVVDYLPEPFEVTNFALDAENVGEQVEMSNDRNSSHPFVGLAFRLEAGRYGQLTYLRV